MNYFKPLYRIVRAIPGSFGEKVRRLLLSKIIPACGTNFLVRENVGFLGVQKLRIGNEVMIGADSCIDATGGVEIGSNVLLGPTVKIISSYYDYTNLHIPFTAQERCYKKVIIENDVWLGANVYIMPGVRLGKGCVVSACSVVTEKEYPPYSILAGNPCRIIGTRGIKNS